MDCYQQFTSIVFTIDPFILAGNGELVTDWVARRSKREKKGWERVTACSAVTPAIDPQCDTDSDTEATLKRQENLHFALLTFDQSIMMSEAPFAFLQCDANGCNKSAGLKTCKLRGVLFLQHMMCCSLHLFKGTFLLLRCAPLRIFGLTIPLIYSHRWQLQVLRIL